MHNVSTNTRSNSDNTGVMGVKNPIRFLGVLLLAGMVAMLTRFGSVSAENGPVGQFAGDYTVSPAVLSGPPTTENGMTSIAGAVSVDLRASLIGTALITFTCGLGVGPGGSNVCEGSYIFEGALRGKEGSYRATMTDWIAGGEAEFTTSDFKLISGSGTGELADLVEAEGKLLRDEAAGPVGVYFGEAQFEIIVVPPSNFTEFTVNELFIMEADGIITIEESVAELKLRARFE